MLHNIEDTLALAKTVQEKLTEATETKDIIKQNLLIDDAKYVTMLLNTELNGDEKWKRNDIKFLI